MINKLYNSFVDWLSRDPSEEYRELDEMWTSLPEGDPERERILAYLNLKDRQHRGEI